jgi:hypothetical protein
MQTLEERLKAWLCSMIINLIGFGLLFGTILHKITR